MIRLTKSFSNSLFYLSDQINRSSLSVVLNIAEGSSKQTAKDFNRYIAIALGSVDETVASLEVAFELNHITKQQFNNLMEMYEAISKQLGGLSKALKKSKA